MAASTSGSTGIGPGMCSVMSSVMRRLPRFDAAVPRGFGEGQTASFDRLSRARATREARARLDGTRGLQEPHALQPIRRGLRDGLAVDDLQLELLADGGGQLGGEGVQRGGNPRRLLQRGVADDRGRMVDGEQMVIVVE